MALFEKIMSIRAVSAMLLTVAFLMFGIASAGAAELVDLALVIATDTSRSVDEVEARLQRDGVSAALMHPQVLEAIRSGYHGKIAIAYIDWSSGPYTTVIVPWRVVSDAVSAEAYVRILNKTPITLGQRTSISEGLELAYKLISDGTVEAPRKIIDVSGDGPNNHGRMVVEARDEVVSKGITINGLPIINSRDQFGPGFFLDDLDNYFRGCVIGGSGAFIIVAKDFQDFAQAMRRKLIFEISGLMPPQNGPRNGIVPVAANNDPQRFGSGYTYERGCDIGERAWRRQLDYAPGLR